MLNNHQRLLGLTQPWLNHGPTRLLEAHPRSRARGFGRDTFVAGMFRPQLAFFYACGFRHEGACHDSSRVSAMPTSRAYGTRYAIHPNMLTHDLHGPHAVIINMDLRVHGHVLYKRRHACSTTTNGCLGCYIKSTTWPQYKYGMPPRVHEHAGSGATHLSLVAHHP